jgi:hypothetical protein
MDSEEQNAFIKAYSSHVAHADEATVERFIEKHLEGIDHNELYKEFTEYYTSIMDAFGVWNSAIQFCKKDAINGI